MLTGLLLAALAVVVALRLAGAERGTLLVLLVGVLPLLLLPAYAVLVAASALRRWRLSAAAGGLVAAHLLLVAPTLVAGADPVADGPRWRVVTANLSVLNDHPVAAGRALRALEPDLLVVPELSPQGLAGLRESGLLDDLPHVVAELGTRQETVGLFSRLPLQDVATRSAAGRELPRATVTLGGRDVRVLAAHPLPPVSVLEPLWRESLRDLTAEAAAVDLPLLVAGDLNADRGHAPFRALLDTGLRDVHDALGRGLARTWPAGLPVLHLDHVLVRDLTPVDVREVRIPGSDHLAVVAEIAVPPPNG